jgi:hypothetical protein
MDRVYEELLREHHREHRQMAFVVGPRQVGKTTTCRSFMHEPAYLSWDDQGHRMLITKGPAEVAARLGLHELRAEAGTVVFDEIHRYARWKSFLKGFFDVHGGKVHTVVTGSSRLDVYQRGGDSLMGRYLLYRMHPLSVGEIVRPRLAVQEIQRPIRIDEGAFRALLRFGGFPEPFLKADTRFWNRWRRLRDQQLLREDVRDLTRVQELGQIQVLAELVQHQSGQLTNHSTLAQRINVSVDTVQRWLATLESLQYCFAVRPWFRNVAKSLRKTPKFYLRDWSMVEDAGARLEAFVAGHLLKAVNWWEDLGLGEYGLHYLRDKEKREVDFLVVKDRKPWFLVEVKASGGNAPSPALFHFQRQTGAAHAFQMVFDRPYIEVDCFERTDPVIVPAQTFLAQLV